MDTIRMVLSKEELKELKFIYELLDSTDLESIDLGIELLEQDFPTYNMCNNIHEQVGSFIMFQTPLSYNIANYKNSDSFFGRFELITIKSKLLKIINQKYYVFPNISNTSFIIESKDNDGKYFTDVRESGYRNN